MQTVTRNELKKWIDAGESVRILNVLDEPYYRKEHIPGSENVPLGRQDFEQQVEQKIGGKDKKVVVYCAHEQCDAAPKAARKLEAAGFKNVFDYSGGLQDWQQAGLPTEGS